MKNAEDQLRQLLDLKYQQDKEQFTKEMIAKKEVGDQRSRQNRVISRAL